MNHTGNFTSVDPTLLIAIDCFHRIQQLSSASERNYLVFLLFFSCGLCIMSYKFSFSVSVSVSVSVSFSLTVIRAVLAKLYLKILSEVAYLMGIWYLSCLSEASETLRRESGGLCMVSFLQHNPKNQGMQTQLTICIFRGRCFMTS